MLLCQTSPRFTRRGRPARVLWGWPAVGALGGEDDVGELATKQPQRGGLVPAPAALPVELGLPRTDAAGLGHRDHAWHSSSSGCRRG